MAECTLAAPAFPRATALPTNGFGGSLHNLIFLVPSYRYDIPYGIETSVPLTWTLIDTYGFRVARQSTADGACLGMVLVTLLYVLFVVPQTKRWKRFHMALLVASGLEVVYLVMVIAQGANRTMARFPAYSSLTQDYTSTYTTGYIVITRLKAVLNFAALTATMVCLLIQASSTLSILRINHRVMYLVTMTYLVLATLVSVIFQLLSFVVVTLQAQAITLARSSFDGTTSLNQPLISEAVRISTAAAITSFCLVAVVSVAFTIVNRGRLFPGESRRLSRYERLLTVLGAVLLQSLIAPVVLVGLVFTNSSTATLSLVVPVVLVLLPFGGLFNADGPTMQSQQQDQRLQEIVVGDGDRLTVGQPEQMTDGSASRIHQGIELEALKLEGSSVALNMVDRELLEIDKL